MLECTQTFKIPEIVIVLLLDLNRTGIALEAGKIFTKRPEPP
jgi:hypothetical protein